MLGVYSTFAEEFMAMPVICGRKTDGERFPGAVDTYSIEAMMQDRKALQAGTSHFLGQNFAKASEIQFLAASGERQFAWTTSWGVSTRLVGGLIMTHSDDDGLVLPPRLAPVHVVITPIVHKPEDAGSVKAWTQALAADLRGRTFDGRAVQVHVDERDMRGGDKAWSWIKKGVPIRAEVGPRDIAGDSVFVARRDRGHKEKVSMKRAEFIANIPTLLQEIQDGLFARARALREQHTKRIDSKSDFEAFFEAPAVLDGQPTPIHAGFALSHFCGDAKVEAEIKDRLGVTIRCVPIEHDGERGACVITGAPSAQRVVWAKAY